MSTDDSLLNCIEPPVVALREGWGHLHAARTHQAPAGCLQEAGDAPRDIQHPCRPKLPRDVLQRALRYVNDNLDAKLTWDEIASAVGMDPFTLGRGFTLSAGITLHQYVTRCRVNQAMRLLARRELSIADIALEVGFSCQSHLTTLFRRHTGTTPAAFRRGGGRSAPLLDPAAAIRSLALGPRSERMAGTPERLVP